jgi:hypothetical protein
MATNLFASAGKNYTPPPAKASESDQPSWREISTLLNRRAKMARWHHKSTTFVKDGDGNLQNVLAQTYRRPKGAK